MRTLPFVVIGALICAVSLAQVPQGTDASADDRAQALAEVERLVARGNKAYSKGKYQNAVEMYGLAADIDPWHQNAGTRQIFALLRSAIALGDRGVAFQNVVEAFDYVKGEQLPDELAREVEVLQGILDDLPQPDTGQPGAGAAGTPGSNSGIQPPALVSQVPPDYPRALERLGIQGDVKLRILVGIDGAVKDIEVLEVPRRGDELGKAATAAVRRWRFEPATENGRPVSTWIITRVTFRLE